MGSTKEFSTSLYSGIYHMGYEKEACDFECKYCLYPTLQDYKDSYHLCKCTAEKDYKERITYHSKEGIRDVKTEDLDGVCCQRKRTKKIVSLSCDLQVCDAAKQLETFGVEKGQLIVETISWQVTKGFYAEDTDVDFWTLYCAFHPKCFMFDICHIIYALFECIKCGNESENWLVMLHSRLENYLRIYNGRTNFEDQYKIIVRSIYNRLCQNQIYGFSLKMFQARIENALQEKRNCGALLPFLVVSSTGKKVFLDALAALLLATEQYLSEWNTYGFKKNGLLAEKCSNLLKEYTAGDIHNDTVSRYEKYRKLERPNSCSKVLNAGKICNLVDRIMRHCQVHQYWTKM